MQRTDIITTIGREYLTSNMENDEFNFQRALLDIGLNTCGFLVAEARRQYMSTDLRFTDDTVTVIMETKRRLLARNAAEDMIQLQQYVIYERELTGNKVIAILYGTLSEEIRVWTDNTGIIDDEHENPDERVIKTFAEYRNMLFPSAVNDKLAVVKNTYRLNELLHGYGIREDIRSQFVGTCLLALKEGLIYEGLPSEQIRTGIETILSALLHGDINRAVKLGILKIKVIDSQDVRDLTPESFHHILRYINSEILPFINRESSMGQDLLNLFFTTFNKYVGKADKNQAFTPDHIVHFMCNVVGINRNSIVLDPCCGSGAFLVRAMTEAMADCDTDEERDNVKKNSIYGVEYEEKAFGLSTTNMLIHSDGNSNIIQGNCFTADNYMNKGVNVVLMNPPYNAQRKYCSPSYTATWSSNTKEDPSKGFHFVYEIAEKVRTGRLAVLLPMQCAIGSSSEIKNYKTKMLERHTLDAVFSLPSDVFHPGASASACCMVFNLGVRHISSPNRKTFFGFFKDDGFVKRKHLGRVESTNSQGNGVWSGIEVEWLNLYRGRLEVAGMSCTKEVTSEDEWLCEAYMKTDYSKLTQKEFESTIRDYLAYKVKVGRIQV